MISYDKIFKEFVTAADNEAIHNQISAEAYSYDIVQGFIKFLKKKKISLVYSQGGNVRGKKPSPHLPYFKKKAIEEIRQWWHSGKNLNHLIKHIREIK